MHTCMLDQAGMEANPSAMSHDSTASVTPLLPRSPSTQQLNTHNCVGCKANPRNRVWVPHHPGDEDRLRPRPRLPTRRKSNSANEHPPAPPINNSMCARLSFRCHCALPCLSSPTQHFLSLLLPHLSQPSLFPSQAPCANRGCSRKPLTAHTMLRQS